MRRLAIVLTLLALVLTGCTAGSGESDGGGRDSAGIAAESSADESGAGALGPPAGDADAADAQAVADVDDAARQVVTEGTVTLTVERPRIAARDAGALVEQAGGHVQERMEQAGEEPGEDTAWLVVRVPADGLTRVLQELERLGRVDRVELTSSDVTAQAQDLDARVRALEISVARLADLLSRAESTSDVVAAERTLTERQSELESMLSRRNRLADQVEMSTVRLEFLAEDGAPPPARAGFTGGLATGWESLVTAFSAGLLVLGVLLPWALVAGVVGLTTLAVRRAIRRRRPALPSVRAAGPPGP